MVNTPEADDLRLLALVERTGTLAGAADSLGISPGAATQRLSRAERRWGCSLVYRNTRGARLSPAGLILASHGNAVERALTQASNDLTEHLGLATRRLRVGAFQAAALHLLPPVLTALRHRQPDLDLSLVDVASNRAIESVAAGETDAAVFATWDAPPEPIAGVTLSPVLRDPMVVALPEDHRLAATPPGTALTLGDLSDETWIVIRSGVPARDQFDAATTADGFNARIRFETAGYDVAQALVAAGVGVALISRLALDLPSGATYRPLARGGPHRLIHVAARTERAPSRLLRNFQELLREVADDISAPWSGRDEATSVS